MNLFIESIEGGVYIAGTGEEKIDMFFLDKYSKTLSFQSLNHIKLRVEGETFENVWLKQNTPYEEMCGLDSSTENPVIKLDW
nr:DUF6482 family protein [uncultured Glaciecola sp.]